MNRKQPAPTVPTITARQVLDAVFEHQRLGPDRALHRLETNEPELAEYVIESLSAVHGELLKLGGRARATHRVYLRAQELVLVSIAAVRGGLGPRTSSVGASR